MEKDNWGVINLTKCLGEYVIFALQDVLISVDDAIVELPDGSDE